MTAPTMHAALPSPLVPPLIDNAQLVAILAEITGSPSAVAQQRLTDEQRHPGTLGLEDFYSRGAAWGVWSDALLKYYSETEDFLYGSIVWNRNSTKLRMRQWIGEYLAREPDRRLKILCYGDGTGFDSFYLAQCGHDVTYFEVSERQHRFARRMFDRAGVHVTMLGDEARIAAGGYDAVVCLDVLEHVPDPPAVVSQLAGFLRGDGRLIVNAPFYFVSPKVPTHLRSNVKYSGSLRLFTRRGLRLLDGRPFWLPLVFGRTGAAAARPGGLLRRWLLRLTGVPFLLSRVWPWPLSRCILTMWKSDPPPPHPLPLSRQGRGE